MAPALQTKWPPIGPESCWGSGVSDACPRRAVTCRLWIRPKAKASNPTHPLLLAGFKIPKVPRSPLLLASSKVPKWHRLCRPNIHPLGLNPAGVLLFRMRADSGPLRALCGSGPIAKASSPTHPLLLAGSEGAQSAQISFAFSGFEGAQMAPALQTKWPPIGPESCCGSAVSDACPRRAVTCLLWIRSKAKASSPTHPLLLAGLKIPKCPNLLCF